MSQGPQELLRRLTAGEESSLRAVMSLTPTDELSWSHRTLPARTRRLIALGALVAVDAPMTSLRWAVELAFCAGADEEEIISVLAIVSREAGLACAVSAAPRLALAIGYDLELRDRDEL
ncbi:MAG: carboxymuconolactone decarboxylase family protein [Solirubrobacteraceae bacterium]